MAPLAINVGFWLYLATKDARAIGAAIILAVVVTVIEANRLCDNLVQLRDSGSTEAVAEASGVLVADRDLCGLFEELEPEFRKLDRRGTGVPPVERRQFIVVDHAALTDVTYTVCTCETISGGAVAAPRRSCPVHGVQS